MKLSDLKPGDKFRMAAMPIIQFTLIRPRIKIFFDGLRIKYAYVSDSHQLYGSWYNYEVIPIRDEILNLEYKET